MVQPLQLESPKGLCCVTGRTLAEGEEYYTALFEEGDAFRRAEYSLAAWTGPPEGCYCHFRTRVPVRKKKRKMFIDDEALATFFRRLAEETEPIRWQFRFVLALILMRKRLLRYDGRTVENGQETWEMTLLSDGSPHRVRNPRLTDAEIAGVSERLSAILHGDMGPWATGDEESDSASLEARGEASDVVERAS